MNSTGTTNVANTVRRGCQACKRKTHLKITCKCNLVVCFDCRYPELHNCTFDYTNEAKKLLEKNNPVIISKKLENV